MKRDLKLNMAHLSDTADSIQNYFDRIEDLKTACQNFLIVLQKQDSVSYQTLSEEWEKGIIGYIDEMEERLTIMETMLSNYIDDMKAYIAPVNAGAMMRVDRNDISYNISQIADGILTVNEIAYDSGSSFPDYKHFLWNRSTEEARLILEEEERERIRREKNYNTLAAFRSGSVSRAFCIFREELEEIQRIYKESIVPFENTDDDYADQARFYYDMWETIGNKWDSLKETTSNAVRGVFDAGVEALDGALSFALYLVFGGFVFSGVVSLPDEVEERVKDVDAGMQAMLKDPYKALEALGQSTTDTYEKEGLAYAIGYLGLDVVVDILVAKGLEKVKGTAKAADTAEAARKAQRAANAAETAEDAAGAAKTAEKAADAAEDAKNASKVVDEVIESGSKTIDNAIPNVESAIINPKKLTEYALNPNHPVGGNKAKVFESALGYNQSNADDLMRQIYKKLPSSEAVLGKLDEYGQRYTVDIPITGPNGNTVNVRTGWIIKTGSDIPELTTIFVKE